MTARWPDVDAYVGALDPGRAAIVRELRALVTTAVPDATESIKWAHPTYESGGPFCYIKALPRYVNLGFWRGAALDDPARVVLVSGQQVGHVRIGSAAGINQDVLTDLVRQAAILNTMLGNPARGR